MQTWDDERRIKKTNRHEINALKDELKLQAKIMAGMLATFWGAYLVNNVWLGDWVSRNLAIKSGTLSGLLGTMITPFLNISVPGAIMSSLMLLFLGWWVMLRDTRDFIVVHLAAMFSSGLALWLFADGAIRWVGWGGVAFGMAGYLMSSGIFERRWGSIISSGLAIALLGGLVSSMLVPGVAMGWAGLAGGFLGGVGSAAYLAKRRKKIADPIDLVGSPREHAKVQFDFSDDDAFSHLEAESRAVRRG